MIKKRLSLFWDPGVFVLQESNIEKKILNQWKNYDTSLIISTNEEYPYGVFFTPNWNLGKINHLWEKIQRSKTMVDWTISSFYIDIDIRDSSFKSMESLFTHILEVIKKDYLPVQYIVESWWWYHLYFFIKEDEREKVWKAFSARFKDIQIQLSTLFDWWDPNAHSLNKLMRLPFTRHWKSWYPLGVTLMKNYKWTFKQVKTVDEISIDEKWCLSADNIAAFMKNTTEVVVAKEKGNIDLGVLKINWLKIRDVIFNLKKYPRQYRGKEYIYFLEWSRLCYSLDWIDYRPNWYRINDNGNYVNNFSMENYSIEDRPRWEVYPFLFHYFNKDRTKLYAFLKEVYSLEFDDNIHLKISASQWDIEFNNEWVIYFKTIQAWDKIQNMQVVLFDTPLSVEWIIKTNYELRWETEQENIYYLIKNIQSDVQFLIDFHPDRKTFNKKYWRNWLMFLWSEMDILDFYMALNKSADQWIIKALDLKYLNWYYDDFYIMWKDIIDWDFNITKAKDMDILIASPDIATNWDKTYISMQDFGKKFQWILSDRVAILSFLWYLILMLWDKFWVDKLKKYKQQIMIPGLFISWKTKSWKTQTITTLKESSNLTYESRKLTIKSTTPQPLKQAACDDFILHLEEYTGMIWEVKEWILRDILNKSKTARWTADWTNVEYIYRSWLILDWEVLPDSESVINRCIVIPMFPQDKMWNLAELESFKSISFLKDFITEIYWHNINVLDHYKQAETILKNKLKIDWRQNSLYSFLLAVNSIFKIFNTQEVVDAIKQNLNMFDSVSTWLDPLGDLFSEVIFNQRVTPTINNLEDTEGFAIYLPLSLSLSNKYKILIMWALKEYSWLVHMEWNNLKIVVDYNDDSDAMKKLSTLLHIYKQYCRLDKFITVKK